MTFPIMLAPPPVVTQTAQTCWACAFESWSEANALLFNISNPYSAQQMIDLFARDPHLTYGHTARASTEGMMVLSALGIMDMRGYVSRRVRLSMLADALDSGYVYLVYLRVGHPAHAVVLYGVDASNLYVMDPMPDAGLVTLPANYLLTLPHGRIVIGKPLLGDLVRGLEDARATLSSALVGARR